MRGLRRHDEEPGLDENRRRLIHSYMDDVIAPAEVAPEAPHPEQREVVEFAAFVAAPEAEVDRVADTTATLKAERPAGHTPAAPILRLPPAAPPSRVAVDVSRRTLQLVARLCEHLDWARVEGERRRAKLAESVPRQRAIPPGSLQAE